MGFSVKNSKDVKAKGKGLPSQPPFHAYKTTLQSFKFGLESKDGDVRDALVAVNLIVAPTKVINVDDPDKAEVDVEGKTFEIVILAPDGNSEGGDRAREAELKGFLKSYDIIDDDWIENNDGFEFEEGVPPDHADYDPEAPTLYNWLQNAINEANVGHFYFEPGNPQAPKRGTPGATAKQISQGYSNSTPLSEEDYEKALAGKYAPQRKNKVLIGGANPRGPAGPGGAKVTAGAGKGAAGGGKAGGGASGGAAGGKATGTGGGGSVTDRLRAKMAGKGQ